MKSSWSHLGPVGKQVEVILGSNVAILELLQTFVPPCGHAGTAYGHLGREEDRMGQTNSLEGSDPRGASEWTRRLSQTSDVQKACCVCQRRCFDAQQMDFRHQGYDYS